VEPVLVAMVPPTFGDKLIAAANTRKTCGWYGSKGQTLRQLSQKISGGVATTHRIKSAKSAAATVPPSAKLMENRVELRLMSL